jgi:segregation and condensation protein B
MTLQDPKRILETALLCAAEPLALDELRSLFDNALGAEQVRALLAELARDWDGRGVELVAVASGWPFEASSSDMTDRTGSG